MLNASDAAAYVLDYRPDIPKEVSVPVGQALGSAISHHQQLTIVLLICGTCLLVALHFMLKHRLEVKKLENEGQSRRDTYDFAHKMVNGDREPRSIDASSNVRQVRQSETGRSNAAKEAR